MKKLVGPKTIAPSKITGYLLNLGSETGGFGKAKFFLSFGFALDKPATLETALLQHPLDHDVLSEVENEGGVKRVLECSMSTPDGRNPCIRTIWVQDQGSADHRFVTAVPMRRPNP